MMMIVLNISNSSLLLLIVSLCSSNPVGFEFSVLRKHVKGDKEQADMANIGWQS